MSRPNPQHQPPDESHLITLPDAAKLLNITVKSAHRMLERDQIEHRQIGTTGRMGQTLVLKSEIEWLRRKWRYITDEAGRPDAVKLAKAKKFRDVF